MNNPQATPGVQPVQIKADDDTLRGEYSNVMNIAHTKEEFVLDFLNVFPPVGTLNARIIASPGHVKRMLEALKDNIAKYESAFGTIQAAQDPGQIGFKAQ